MFIAEKCFSGKRWAQVPFLKSRGGMAAGASDSDDPPPLRKTENGENPKIDFTLTPFF